MRHLIPKYPQLPSLQWHILKSLRSRAGSEQKAGTLPLCEQWDAALGTISHQLHINHWEFRT